MEKLISIRVDDVILEFIEELARIWKVKGRSKKYRSQTIRLAIIYAYMHVKYGIALGRDPKEKAIKAFLKELLDYEKIVKK